MKTTDMRKILVVMSIITGIMVLVVIVKFFVLDPAEENRTLNQRLLITESTVELLRDELSRSNLSFYEKDDEIARLSEEIRKLKEENAAIGGDVSDTNALIASYRDEIGRLEKELESAKTDNERLEELERELETVKKTLDELDAARNTAYTHLLSQFSTVFTYTDKGRATNIEIAARSISGMIVMPGEEFSFFDVVGECTVPKGYCESTIFYAGELARGIGGGICQVSSTLYNTALIAGMKITERHPHSMRVSYAQPGRDATVNYGYLDLRFVNPYDKPIKIVATAENGKLIFSFYCEYKAIKLPKIVINVKVNSDGDYVMTRTVDGKADYTNTSRYKK